jgi:hypothetical protein
MRLKDGSDDDCLCVVPVCGFFLFDLRVSFSGAGAVDAVTAWEATLRGNLFFSESPD